LLLLNSNLLWTLLTILILSNKNILVLSRLHLLSLNIWVKLSCYRCLITWLMRLLEVRLRNWKGSLIVLRIYCLDRILSNLLLLYTTSIALLLKLWIILRDLSLYLCVLLNLTIIQSALSLISELLLRLLLTSILILVVWLIPILLHFLII
jgi:hypothetical protein